LCWTTTGITKGTEDKLEDILGILIDLDNLYQTMTLNHVARRASAAQGVALLNLYTKALSPPTPITAFPVVRNPHHENQIAELVNGFKLKIRREEVPGHLPICWGILTAGIGLEMW
jgi:urease accessory protein